MTRRLTISIKTYLKNKVLKLDKYNEFWYFEKTVTSDQKKKLLKAKIAVALQDELGRVPKKEEIERVFLLTRVMYKAILGLHFKRQEQKKAKQLAIFWETIMLIGYARVSTYDQTLHLQQDALTKAGCNKIFTDTASGAKAERKGLEEALSYIRGGDTLVVWRLDRLGRSLRDLIATMTMLDERKIGFKSLTENIDTTTSGGKLVFHIFGALAEFERNLIRERTQAGLSAARARGKRGGRPKALRDRRVGIAQALYNNKQNSIADICHTLKISKATLYRYIKTGDRDQQSSV
jgi:DNA invertase Pin-like site-specific DNA recombinase